VVEPISEYTDSVIDPKRGTLEMFRYGRRLLRGDRGRYHHYSIADCGTAPRRRGRRLKLAAPTGEVFDRVLWAAGVSVNQWGDVTQ